MASQAAAQDHGPKLDVEQLHFQLVVTYVTLMKELRLRFQSLQDKTNKTKVEADTRVAYTRNLLAKIKRPADLYPLCRLLFPQYDSRKYGMKGSELGRKLAEAVPTAAKDIQALTDTKTDIPVLAAGLAEVMQTRVRDPKASPSLRLTIKQINEYLDRLAGVRAQPKAPGASRSTPSKRVSQLATALASITSRVFPDELTALFIIILQGKHERNISAENFLSIMHPDALEVYKTDYSMARVCKRCIDPSVRITPQLAAGQPFHPQTCARPSPAAMKAAHAGFGAAAVAEHLMSRIQVDQDAVVETKFDGWRLAVHIIDDGGTQSVRYFTRNESDSDVSSKYKFEVVTPALLAQVQHRSAIFDGEIVGWHKALQEFLPFNVIKQIVYAAAREVKAGEEIVRIASTAGAEGGMEPGQERSRGLLAEDVEIVYCAFDLLQHDGASVAHEPLARRHELLRRALAPCPAGGCALQGGRTAITGRVVPIVPGSAPLVPGCPASQFWSVRIRTAAEMLDALKRVEKMDYEGVVLKPLYAPYTFGAPKDEKRERQAWVKWKRDYGQSWDADCVVVGAQHGRGGRQVGLKSYICALMLTDASASGKVLATFIRVSSGLNAEERREVHSRLQGNLVDAGPRPRGGACSSAPEWLHVATEQEWPDYWVEDYTKSVVLEIKGDVRLQESNTYGTGFTMRFPRIERMREDKSWQQVDTMATLREKVQEMQLQAVRRTTRTQPRQTRRTAAKVSAVFGMVESDAPAEMQALEGMYIVVLPQSCVNAAEQRELADMIARAGAKPSGGVKPGRGDRVIVGQAPAARYRAQLNAHIKRCGTDVDVLTADWLQSCLLCGGDKQPLPRHFVHMSASTALALASADGRDEYGTDLQLEPSVQDTRVMLLQQVPRIDECAIKAKVLAAAPRARTRELEQSAAAERHVSADALQSFARTLRDSDAPQVRAIASLASLLGRRIVLLFLPMDITRGLPAVQQADSQSLEFVAQLWGAWVAQHSGRVIASSVEAAAAMRAAARACPPPDCAAPYTSATFAQATDVALLPLGSYSALTSSMLCRKGRLSHEDARAAALHGLVYWTPCELVEALGAIAPDYTAFAVLLQRLEAGSVALRSAAHLLPELFGGADPGLAQTCLSVPGPAASSAERRAWLIGLPWQEQGHKAMLQDCPGGTRRRRKKRQASDSDGEPQPKARRARRAKAAGVRAAVPQAATASASASQAAAAAAVVAGPAAEAEVLVTPPRPRQPRARARQVAAQLATTPQAVAQDSPGGEQGRQEDHGGTGAERGMVARDCGRAEAAELWGGGVLAGAGGSPDEAGGVRPAALGQDAERETRPVTPGERETSQVRFTAGSPGQLRRRARRGPVDPAFATATTDEPPVTTAAAAGNSVAGARVEGGLPGASQKGRAMQDTATKARALQGMSLMDRLRAGLESDSD
eukprot:jgi/Ulvmu1/4122/UM019_0101.1